MTETSLLDERLAEIDERLRTLQSSLEPVADTPSPEPPPAPGAGSGESDDPPSGELAAVAQRLQEPPLSLSLSRPTPLRAASPPPPSALAAAAAAHTTLPSAATPSPERLIGQLRELGEAHERLLALHRDLLYQYAEVLEQRAAQTATVSVTAGPFTDGDAVSAFENGLRGLPGVCATTTREYLAGDRVAIDVRLAVAE